MSKHNYLTKCNTTYNPDVEDAYQRLYTKALLDHKARRRRKTTGSADDAASTSTQTGEEQPPTETTIPVDDTVGTGSEAEDSASAEETAVDNPTGSGTGSTSDSTGNDAGSSASSEDDEDVFQPDNIAMAAVTKEQLSEILVQNFESQDFVVSLCLLAAVAKIATVCAKCDKFKKKMFLEKVPKVRRSFKNQCFGVNRCCRIDF